MGEKRGIYKADNWHVDDDVATDGSGRPLKNPVRAHHSVSRDLSLSKTLLFTDGSRATALEIMWECAAYAKRFVEHEKLSSVWHDVVEKWEGVLEGLEGDRQKHSLSRSLDWVAKERILKRHINKTGVDPLHDSCRIRDLQYHTLQKEESITRKRPKEH